MMRHGISGPLPLFCMLIDDDLLSVRVDMLACPDRHWVLSFPSFLSCLSVPFLTNSHLDPPPSADGPPVISYNKLYADKPLSRPFSTQWKIQNLFRVCVFANMMLVLFLENVREVCMCICVEGGGNVYMSKCLDLGRWSQTYEGGVVPNMLGTCFLARPRDEPLGSIRGTP